MRLYERMNMGLHGGEENVRSGRPVAIFMRTAFHLWNGTRLHSECVLPTMHGTMVGHKMKRYVQEGHGDKLSLYRCYCDCSSGADWITG